MKRIQLLKSPGLVLTALLMASASLAFAQTTNYYVNQFTTANNTQDGTPSGCAVWYGSSEMFWDGTTADPLAGAGDYSAYIYVDLTDTSGNDMEDVIVPGPNDNLWYNGDPAGVNLSDYVLVSFDVLWDTNYSTISIDQFNDVQAYNTNDSALESSDPNIDGVGYGLDVQVGGLGTTSPEPVSLGYADIPDAASNGWVTVTVPINPNESGIDGACGILIKKWIGDPTAIPANAQAYFWIGNVWFEGSATPPPPPTLQTPTTPTPGLNVFASTEGNSYYDRQEVGLVASNGVSWVGNDLTSPVTYSFTINGFPQNPATENACEAYLMMAPNPAYYDNAIDYNETNAVIFDVQQVATNSAIMNFQYKVNDPNSEDFTTIGTVTNNGTALGTWSISFSSDTNVTLTAPDGSTSSFVFTNASYFAEVNDPGCYLYLGMQANNAATLNQAVCYSQFSLTGVPAATNDNFLTDSTLNTNIWFNFMADGTAGVFVMPSGAEDWITWNTPAAGFHLQVSPSLSSPSWTGLTSDLVIPGVDEYYQLVTTNDIPTWTPAEFFELASP